MSSKFDPTPHQKDAIEEINSNLQIIACAGSGKTEVITRRIAYILKSKSDVKPENIVAFTFTEKAAESLKRRIEAVLSAPASGMYIGTIHGFCKHLLSKYTEQFAEFKVLDTVKNHLFISRYADKCGMTDLQLKPCLPNNNLFLQCIDKLIDDYDNREKWTDTHKSVLNQYIDCLYDHGYIDFSLLIFEALKQIKENPSVQSYLRSIKYLVVDEYQDVNDLQEKLIATIVNLGANICVVGDDDQTIYQFRGSNADNMISFSKRYSNVHQVRLEENFRCAPDIVDVAGCVIGHNERRLQKRMRSAASKKENVIYANGFSDIEDEFEAIAKQIETIHTEGVPYNHIAVLVRKGKHIAPLSKILESKQIPYSADSAESFFTGNYFCRFIEIIKTLDNIDKAAFYEQWENIAERTRLSIAFKYLRSCSHGGNYRLSDIIRGFCEKIDFLNENACDFTTRFEDVEGICKILDDYDEIYGDYQLSARITGLLKFLVEQARQEYKYHSFRTQSSAEDAVHLMTVHKSKGLEFHTVFLPRLNKREFPVSNIGGRQYYHVLGGAFAENKAKYASDVEDERKLFYVAITRAEQNLYLSYTLEKQPVSEFVSNAAESEFLQINREDLYYQPQKPTYSTIDRKNPISDEQRQQRDRERAEKAEYWENVRHAKDALHQYYSDANHYCKGIILEYSDICKKGPEAILAKARELGEV